MSLENKPIGFNQAIVPLLFFVAVLVIGLFVFPVILKKGMLPLEILILLAFSFNCVYLMFLGYGWKEIQKSIQNKVGESVGVILILFSIGVLIGSWIVSGTIPMLIYYGISIVNPQWIYVFAFLICILFSMLTGTSWGSAGTIGIVMIGISEVYEAELAITAAAIVGGSFFGDKLSPLSDTTNVASLATDVALFDHIRSMLYTTGPAAIIAIIYYVAISPYWSAETSVLSEQPENIINTLNSLKTSFNFNPILLLPLLLVIWGSVAKKPTVLVLLGSSWLAMILAFVFQDFNLQDIFESFKSGFSVNMTNQESTSNEALQILNRGGLYNLIEGITSCFLIFAFIGTLDVINAIELVIKNGSKLRSIFAALSSTLFTNLTTSNQYATSFIIGEAFRRKFDKMKLPRKVLSRSIEDAGTMMENLAPWTPSGIFMASTLGVSALEYAPYQVMSLANIVIAYFFALTGMAFFTKRENE